jgi:hypothetical protein
VYYEESPRIQEVLKFNETLQVLVNTDYVNLLLERINTIKGNKDTKVSLVPCARVGLKVNSE